MPSLRKPENDLLVLVCHCASLGAADQPLRKWAASEEGRRVYQQTATGMREPHTSEQAILSLSALLCHEVLLDASDEVSSPSHGSCLHDFDRLVNGHEVRNRRAVWERMALSIKRVAGEKCHPAAHYFLDIVTGSELPLQDFDWLSDQYWTKKLGYATTHGGAWEQLRRKFDGAATL